MSNLTNSPFAELFASKLQDKMDESMAFTALWDNVSSWASNRFVNIPQYTASATIMQDYVEVGGANYSFGDSGDNRVAEGNLRFELISHQTKPLTVTSLEDSITNYDKHGGTIRNTISGLVEFKGKSLLFQAGKDVAVSRTFLTTGAATSKGPLGTTRLAMTFQDFVNLGLAFDEDNVAEEGRFIILPAQMYADVISDPVMQKANELGTGEAPIATGVVAKIAGINIMKKNTVLQMSGNTVGGDDAVDPFEDINKQEYHGAIAFVRDAIAYATTPVEVFENSGDTKKYGDEFSSQIFGSANVARSDGKGLYIITQG